MHMPPKAAAVGMYMSKTLSLGAGASGLVGATRSVELKIEAFCGLELGWRDSGH